MKYRLVPNQRNIQSQQIQFNSQYMYNLQLQRTTTTFSDRGKANYIHVFCVSIPNKIQEGKMSVTHRPLRALLLAPDVWDLPLVVDWCYRLRVAPLAVFLCSTSFWCILL